MARIDSKVESTFPAGDHDIVLGRVAEMGLGDLDLPLLFFRGGYGRFTPTSLALGDEVLYDHLRLVDMARREMESVAPELQTECIAVSRVNDELVLIASAGQRRDSSVATRVGQRVPFAPPFGAVFPAGGSENIREAWISCVSGEVTPEQVAAHEALLRDVVNRGYAVRRDERGYASLEFALAAVASTAGESRRVLWNHIEAIRQSVMSGIWDDVESAPLRNASAPVFEAQGRVVLQLTIHGPGDGSHLDDKAVLSRLVVGASRGTLAGGGIAPQPLSN